MMGYVHYSKVVFPSLGQELDGKTEIVNPLFIVWLFSNVLMVEINGECFRQKPSHLVVMCHCMKVKHENQKFPLLGET